jgi:uncharacterized protein YjbI with pentapeptide repeats
MQNIEDFTDFGNCSLDRRPMSPCGLISPVTCLIALSKFTKCDDVAKYIVMLMILGSNRKIQFVQLDLSNLNLAKICLEDEYIYRVNFNNTILNNANFDRAKIESSSFINAKMSNAILTKTNMFYSYFNGAMMNNSNIQHARFHNTNLVDVNLNDADCSHVLFNVVNLQRALFNDGTILINVKFIRVNTRGVNFRITVRDERTRINPSINMISFEDKTELNRPFTIEHFFRNFIMPTNIDSNVFIN